MSEQTPNPPWGGARPPQPGSPAPQSWGPPASAAYGGFGAQSAEPTWGQDPQQGSWQTPDGAWQVGAQAPARAGLGVGGRHFGLAALIGVAAYLAAAVASIIVMLLQGLALDNKSGAGNFVVSIPTWVAGSFGNSRILSYSIGDTTRSASWGAVGVFVVAVALLSVVLLGRALLRKAPVGKGIPRLVLASVTSLVFFALMLVLALTVHWSSSQTIGSQTGTISIKAVSVLGIIIALVSVGFVAYLAFSPRGDGLLPSSVRRAGSQFVEHVLVVGSVVSLVYYFVYSASVGKSGWLSFLEIVPGWGVVTSPTASATPFGGTPPATQVDPTVFMGFLNGFNLSTFGAYNRGTGHWESMFAGGAWWLILVCLLMLVLGLLWASLRWRLRSGAVDSAPASWLTLPAIYLVGGIIILVSSITNTPDLRAEDKTVVGFVAPWAFALVMLLGVAVEALSRFLAPAVLRSAGGLRGLLGLGISADWTAAQAQPVAPAGWGGAQAGAPLGQQPGWGQPAGGQGAWGAAAQGVATAPGYQAGQSAQATAPSGRPAWGGQQSQTPAPSGQPAWGGQQTQAPASSAQPAWGGQQSQTPPPSGQAAWGGAPSAPQPAQPAWGTAQTAPAQNQAGPPAAPGWDRAAANQPPQAPQRAQAATAAQPPQPGWGAPAQPAGAQQGQAPTQPAAGGQGVWGAPPAPSQPGAPAQQAWGAPPQQQTPQQAQTQAPNQNQAWGSQGGATQNPWGQQPGGSAPSGQLPAPAWGQQPGGPGTAGQQPAPAWDQRPGDATQQTPAWGPPPEAHRSAPNGQVPQPAEPLNPGQPDEPEQPGQPGQQPPQTGWRP